MDRLLVAGETEEIMDALERSYKELKKGEHIIVSQTLARDLLNEISEVYTENAELSALPPSKPRMLYMEKPINAYINPGAIALIVFDPQGNAGIQTVNGALIQVEALQWQMMREKFHESVDLVVVKSTQGLVSA